MILIKWGFLSNLRDRDIRRYNYHIKHKIKIRGISVRLKAILFFRVFEILKFRTGVLSFCTNLQEFSIIC